MGKFHPRFLHLLLSALCAFAAGASPPSRPTEQTADTKQGEVRRIVRIECKGSVTSYAVSPDAKRLAYCDTIYLPDNKGWAEFVLLDLATGKELQRKKANYVKDGTFSTDARLLALGHGVTCSPTLWDVEQWTERLVLELPKNYREGMPLAFSPDGKTIAGSTGFSDSEAYQLL
ncbi:MAG: hypothetical protein L0312_30415, partial [Acidobacteria bacterium]|nr:hypothetical protein [Acidobacteriota bacterium]